MVKTGRSVETLTFTFLTNLVSGGESSQTLTFLVKIGTGGETVKATFLKSLVSGVESSLNLPIW